MDDMTVEVIADGKHLPSTILRLVYKLKGVERTCLVTDALSYAASDVKPDEGSVIGNIDITDFGRDESNVSFKNQVRG